MLRRLSNLYHSINRLPRIDHAVGRLPEIAESVSRKPWLMSPVERYLYLMAINNHKHLFDSVTEQLEMKRITKILDIYGVEYFRGKSVVELGAGHGNVGAFLAELGAEVLYVDGRRENMNIAMLKHRSVPSISFTTRDLDGDFSNIGRFDLVIDFGLVYHLRNIKEHVEACFAISDDILLESVVCDSLDESRILFLDEDSEIYLNSLSGTGTRPSAGYLERLAREHSFAVSRYFDADLNAGKNVYDWEAGGTQGFKDDLMLRRFWRLTRAGSGPGQSPT